MLIFVDKKKEKRRKIKIICTVCFAIFFILMNIIHFKSALHLSSNDLSKYQSHTISNDWYKEADIIYLFSSKQNSYTKIILIPHIFNRENITTTALAFSKLPKQKTYLSFTKELSNIESLKKLASLFFPLTNKAEAKQQIIISSSLEDIHENILQNKLYPLALNYKHSHKLNNLSDLTALLDTIFPPKPSPQNKLEEEKEALQNFAKENQSAIKDIILNQKQPSFALQNIFLNKNRFCLQSINEKKCSFHSNLSFIKNLQKMSTNNFSPDKLQKLILLTNDMFFTSQNISNITKDEGLHFVFNNHEAFLFPDEINSLAEKEKALYILKEKAGLNPEYQNPAMKLYKFKTLEIDLNDNI